MNDTRFDSILSSWLKGTAVAAPDARRSATEVVGTLAGVRQRRPRWRGLRVRGSTRSGPRAVGPVLALAAGAVAFGLAGLLLVARPIAPTAVDGPGSATEALGTAPVEVAGTVFRLGECEGPGGAEGGLLYTSLVCVPRAAWSDRRLNGTLTITERKSAFLDHEDVFFWTFAVDIVNDEGAWRMRPLWVDFPGAVPNAMDTWILDGEGAYDGLVAVLQAESHPPHAKLEFEDWPGYTPHGFIVQAADIEAGGLR